MAMSITFHLTLETVHKHLINEKYLLLCTQATADMFNLDLR